MMMNKKKSCPVKRNFSLESLIIWANCFNDQYVKQYKQTKLCIIFYILIVILELYCLICLPLATCGY